jgi:hypothetical protein
MFQVLGLALALKPRLFNPAILRQKTSRLRPQHG